jgi:uncharacterized protein with HEPN domain
MHDTSDLLNDILEAIADIDEIRAQGKESFLHSRILQAAALYRFNIIGEAVGKLPEELKAHYPQVDWRRVKAFRNLAIHGYRSVDFEITWGLIAHRVPELQTVVVQMMQDVANGDNASSPGAR